MLMTLKFGTALFAPLAVQILEYHRHNIPVQDFKIEVFYMDLMKDENNLERRQRFYKSEVFKQAVNLVDDNLNMGSVSRKIGKLTQLSQISKLSSRLKNFNFRKIDEIIGEHKTKASKNVFQSRNDTSSNHPPSYRVDYGSRHHSKFEKNDKFKTVDYSTTANFSTVQSNYKTAHKPINVSPARNFTSFVRSPGQSINPKSKIVIKQKGLNYQSANSAYKNPLSMSYNNSEIINKYSPNSPDSKFQLPQANSPIQNPLRSKLLSSLATSNHSVYNLYKKGKKVELNDQVSINSEVVTPRAYHSHIQSKKVINYKQATSPLFKKSFLSIKKIADRKNHLAYDYKQPKKLNFEQKSINVGSKDLRKKFKDLLKRSRQKKSKYLNSSQKHFKNFVDSKQGGSQILGTREVDLSSGGEGDDSRLFFKSRRKSNYPRGR